MSLLRISSRLRRLNSVTSTTTKLLLASYSTTLFSQSMTTRASHRSITTLSKNHSFLMPPFVRTFGDSLDQPVRELQHCDVHFMGSDATLRDLRDNNGFFVDNTKYLLQLDAIRRKHFLFVRPTRFGKTLLLQTMEMYYDKAIDQATFERYLGDTAVGRHVAQHRAGELLDSAAPCERGQWHVLKLSLSLGVNNLEARLNNVLNDALCPFAKRYALPFKIDERDALSSLTRAATAVEEAGGKLMILVDEYDKTVNTLLVDEEDAAAIKKAMRPIAAFYDQLKALDGVVTKGYRVFSTGVTPLALGSISGYNLAESLTHEEEFAGMVGFTKADVERALESIKHLSKEERVTILGKMQKLFNGYRFVPDATPLYNSTMANHFLHRLATKVGFTEDVLLTQTAEDMTRKFAAENVGSAQSMSRTLVAKTAAGTRAVIDAAAADEEKGIEVKENALAKSFSINEFFSQRDDEPAYHRALSFLLYQGVQTFGKRRTRGYDVIVVPNASVRVDDLEFLKSLVPIEDLVLDLKKNRVTASSVQLHFEDALREFENRAQIKHEAHFELVVWRLLKFAFATDSRWCVETQVPAKEGSSRGRMDVLIFRLPEPPQEGKPQEVENAYLLELKSTHHESEMSACLQAATKQAQNYAKMLKSGEVPRLAGVVSKFTHLRVFAAARFKTKVQVVEVD